MTSHTPNTVLFLIFLCFMVMASCSNNEHEPAEIAMESSLQDIEGRWQTPPAYADYEQAELLVNTANETINGRLRYERKAEQETSESSHQPLQFYFEGAIVGNATEITIRSEEGDQIGTARLTLRNGELHFHLLNRSATLPEIFVLERV